MSERLDPEIYTTLTDYAEAPTQANFKQAQAAIEAYGRQCGEVVAESMHYASEDKRNTDEIAHDELYGAETDGR